MKHAASLEFWACYQDLPEAVQTLADKNFALSDKIRDDLKAIGVQLKDGKDGEIGYSVE